MEDINNTNQNTPQEEKNSIDIIHEILERNGLEETLEEAFEKDEQDKPSKIIIISDLIKEIRLGKILEKDIIDVLQKKLGTTKEIAKKLASDIEKDISLLTEKTVPREEKPMNLKEIEKSDRKPQKTTKKIGRIEKINELPKKTEQEERPKSSGSNSYREPIE